MRDLTNRLRDLDELDTPDVWERATNLDPRGPDPEPTSNPTGKRVLAAVVALAVFVAAGVFALRAFQPPTTSGDIPPGSADGQILWPERTSSDLQTVQTRADDG